MICRVFISNICIKVQNQEIITYKERVSAQTPSTPLNRLKTPFIHSFPPTPERSGVASASECNARFRLKELQVEGSTIEHGTNGGFQHLVIGHALRN